MRKFRIVSAVCKYRAPNDDGLVYSVQVYDHTLLGYLGNWYDVDNYKSLEEAKKAMSHLQKPDIYDLP